MSLPISYRRLHQLRRVSQVSGIAFLAGAALLNLAGVHWVVGTLYSISIGPLDIADPAMVLQTALLTRELYLPLLLAGIIPVVLAAVLGRVFCSWLCPYNTLLDALDAVSRRLRRRGWLQAQRRPGSNPRPLVQRAVLLALLLVALATGLPLLSFLSAPGILSSQLAQGVMGLGLGPELAAVGALLVAEAALLRRWWCKYACPVGSTLGLLHTRYTLRIKCDATRCSCPPGSEACHVACPLGLQPRAEDTHPYCYNCGECLVACEKTKRHALQLSFRPRTNGRAQTSPVPAAAEAVLAGVTASKFEDPHPARQGAAGEGRAPGRDTGL